MGSRACSSGQSREGEGGSESRLLSYVPLSDDQSLEQVGKEEREKVQGRLHCRREKLNVEHCHTDVGSRRRRCRKRERERRETVPRAGRERQGRVKRWS